MIKQQRKTNALLRARTQTVSASLAPARTGTRPVQQQQHHARSGGSRLKNETPPITELSQERSSMQRPALATPCPLALRSAAACTRTGTGTRARSRPAPRACPEHYTPPLPRRQDQLRRVDRRNHRVLSKLNVWVAHMRIALSYNELKYVTMRTHRLLCACGSKQQSAERALAQPPKYTRGERKYDLYHHHSHPSQKCKYHNP